MCITLKTDYFSREKGDPTMKDVREILKKRPLLFDGGGEQLGCRTRSSELLYAPEQLGADWAVDAEMLAFSSACRPMGVATVLPAPPCSTTTATA